jgi:signal transduction histidine kinase
LANGKNGKKRANPMTTADQKNPGASLASSGITFLRRGEVLKRLGIGHSTLFDKIAEGAIPPPVPLPLGNRVQLQQVVLNLIVNAVDAIDSTTDGNRLLEITAN